MKKYIIKIISIILIISFSLNQISYAGGDFSHLRPAACRASIPLTEASFSGIHYAGLKGLEALLTDINRRRAEGGLPHDEDTIAKTKELRSMIQRMLSEDKPDTSLIWMKDRKDPPAELFTLTFESYDVRQIIKEDVSVNEATLKKYPQLRKKWPIYRELLKSYIFIISHLYPILVELQWKVGVNCS